MVGKEMLDRFAQESPVPVMVRAVLENTLSAEFLDELFREHAEKQVVGNLLFSTIVDLMTLVVCNIRPSIHAAYQARRDEIEVAVKSVYNKINGVEPAVAAALVGETAGRLAVVVDELGATLPPILPGYTTKIVDGNHLAATEHRLGELRRIAAGPLPGLALVVLDPQRMLVESVVPCEDGYTQERKLVGQLVDRFQPGDVWIADRNFCMAAFLWELHVSGAFFVVRQHATNVRSETAGRRRKIGRGETGVVDEQPIKVHDDFGNVMPARRVTVRLDTPTRDGGEELSILTNLPEAVDAAAVADAYRRRWTIETAFGELDAVLQSEISSLGYPGAALFAFCVSLLAYNVLSVVKAALRSVHGEKKVRQEVSAFYLAEEVRGVWRGMAIAVPADQWEDAYAALTPKQLAGTLKRLAGNVRLSAFRKHVRGVKKKPPKRTRKKNQPHVSTARILAARKRKT